MFTFIHARREARQLTRKLRKSLTGQEDLWATDADHQGRPILSAGRFRIMIVPRCPRLFDTIHLYCEETEIWLPLLPRIRLRGAVRWYLVHFAKEQWLAPCGPSEVRVGTRQEQPV